MSAFLAGLILVASPAAPAVDIRAENLAVSRADTEMAAAAVGRDLKRFTGYLAEDVIFVPEGAPLAAGRQGVAGLWGDLFKEDGPSLTWRPTLSYVASSGDLAYTEGEFLSKGRTPEGKEASRTGRYVTVWRKQLDGSWRAVVDIGNRTKGPAAGAGRQAVVRSETSESGELQYALSAYESEAKDATGKPVKRVGRYLMIKRRQPDGSWRVVVNADTAPEPATASR
jgi:ketosteroid isomerase-like protein